MLRHEQYVAELAQSTSVYASNAKKALTGDAVWNKEKGDPLKDIEAGMEVVRANIGLRPNVITMGPV